MMANLADKGRRQAHGLGTHTDSMARIDLAIKLIFYLQSVIHFVYN